jgi:hypothetical protein
MTTLLTGCTATEFHSHPYPGGTPGGFNPHNTQWLSQAMDQGPVITARALKQSCECRKASDVARRLKGSPGAGSSQNPILAAGNVINAGDAPTEDGYILASAAQLAAVAFTQLVYAATVEIPDICIARLESLSPGGNASPENHAAHMLLKEAVAVTAKVHALSGSDGEAAIAEAMGTNVIPSPVGTAERLPYVPTSDARSHAWFATAARSMAFNRSESRVEVIATSYEPFVSSLFATDRLRFHLDRDAMGLPPPAVDALRPSARTLGATAEHRLPVALPARPHPPAAQRLRAPVPSARQPGFGARFHDGNVEHRGFGTIAAADDSDPAHTAGFGFGHDRLPLAVPWNPTTASVEPEPTSDACDGFIGPPGNAYEDFDLSIYDDNAHDESDASRRSNTSNETNGNVPPGAQQRGWSGVGFRQMFGVAKSSRAASSEAAGFLDQAYKSKRAKGDPNTQPLINTGGRKILGPLGENGALPLGLLDEAVGLATAAPDQEAVTTLNRYRQARQDALLNTPRVKLFAFDVAMRVLQGQQVVVRTCVTSESKSSTSKIVSFPSTSTATTRVGPVPLNPLTWDFVTGIVPLTLSPFTQGACAGLHEPTLAGQTASESQYLMTDSVMVATGVGSDQRGLVASVDVAPSVGLTAATPPRSVASSAGIGMVGTLTRLLQGDARLNFEPVSGGVGWKAGDEVKMVPAMPSTLLFTHQHRLDGSKPTPPVRVLKTAYSVMGPVGPVGLSTVADVVDVVVSKAKDAAEIEQKRGLLVQTTAAALWERAVRDASFGGGYVPSTLTPKHAWVPLVARAHQKTSSVWAPMGLHMQSNEKVSFASQSRSPATQKLFEIAGVASMSNVTGGQLAQRVRAVRQHSALDLLRSGCWHAKGCKPMDLNSGASGGGRKDATASQRTRQRVSVALP